MRTILSLVLFDLLVFSASSSNAAENGSVLSWPAGLPIYDHIVVVFEENKDYEQIIDQPAAPYINQLKAEGANFTQCYGEEHHSQGNYFWFFSGSNHGVGFKDIIPDSMNNPAYPFTASNLGQQLALRGKSFKGYSESLPAIGFDGEKADADRYQRKHVPWISFQNLPQGNTVETSCNLRFKDFPTRFEDLPTVSIIVPNQENDMHNGSPPTNIQAGDMWLKTNLDQYYQWAKTHNSLLIVTFDESDHKANLFGLTDPFVVGPPDDKTTYIRNRIATIFAGARIKPGDYPEGKGITHVNILRTIEAMYGCVKSGGQQPNALTGGISDDYLITDIFQ